ncbi:Exostosin family protein [Rhynchospora pubera]|uniref:Exostosin family protein n=1 Tax=Rhynchospora pubera TaxID=906938 RepID=A0AAV8BVW2_9POAL|nr:Exostosin family protein [Rhynchospora pubera]
MPQKGEMHLLLKNSKDMHQFPILKSTKSQTLHRGILFISFLSIQLILFLFSRPIQLFKHSASPCDAGLIYVYNLPPAFNRDLIAACEKINPWPSRCPSLSSPAGLGLPVIDSDHNFTDLMPVNLLQSWFSTDQFALELIFHHRMLNHQCRTLNPSKAAAFYIPFYVGLALEPHLWSPNSTSYDRDRDGLSLLQWLQIQSPYQKSHGWDHFITLGRITWDFRRSHQSDWGSSFLYMTEMGNITRLLIERDPWDEKDVAVPYPTGFHPRSLADVQEWQQFVLNRKRKTLFGYVGAPRSGFKNDFRGLLLNECVQAGSKCRSVDCNAGKCINSSAETMELFLDSEFCLQPRGDSFTRRSLFDCMVAGSVPVLFWKRSAYMQYKLYLPGYGDEPEWSVFIDRRDMRERNVSVRSVLEGIREDKIRELRERVVKLIPRLVYAAESLGEGMDDAFDIALKGVLRQFKDRRRRMKVAITK